MADSWSLEPGDRIGRHLRTLSLLGGGREHEVMLAVDDRRLTTVVVKLLRPDRRGEEGLARLRQEARRLEAVRHPAFPRLLELVDDGEQPHLVMEHVEGPRLSRLVRRFGPLSLEQLLPLAVDVAGALHYLHGLGLVHLDIKPSNLVVSDRVRVVDLGLARPVAAAAGLQGRAGTVSWMAPEQHRPRDGQVGSAADIWAWGAVMLFASTGDWPLRHARERGGGDWYPTPAEVGAITVPGSLPSKLSSAIADALAWRTHDRPAAMALARRLEPLVDRVQPQPASDRAGQ